MIYLINYDIKTRDTDKSKFINTVKSADGWWHHLKDTWIISTDESLDNWNEKLRIILNDNDSLLVVDITGKERNGWLPINAWDWLNKNDVDNSKK